MAEQECFVCGSVGVGPGHKCRGMRVVRERMEQTWAEAFAEADCCRSTEGAVESANAAVGPAPRGWDHV